MSWTKILREHTNCGQEDTRNREYGQSDFRCRFFYLLEQMYREVQHEQASYCEANIENDSHLELRWPKVSSSIVS